MNWRTPKLKMSWMQNRMGEVVALTLFTIYLCMYSGLYHAADELSIVTMAESMLADGSVHVNQMEWEQTWLPSQNTWGVDGNLYSKKGIGLSLLILPFLAIGKLLVGIGGITGGAVSVALLTGSLLTAATGWLLFSATQFLGMRPATGVVTALAWGLGTLALVYAGMLRIEPLAALGIAMGIHGCIAFRQHLPRSEPRWLVEVGFGTAIVILAKPALAVVASAFILFVLQQLLWEFRSHFNWRHTFIYCFVALIPALAAVAVTIIANYQHFYSLFSYPMTDPTEGFITPLQIGLAGLLLSPGKGLLWYVPITWLIPFSLRWWRRHHDFPIFLLLITIFFSTLLLFATWSDWAGGRNWGPRMIVPLLPALALLVAPLWDAMLDSLTPTWKRWLIGGIGVVSIAAQLPGVLVNITLQEGVDIASGVSAEQLLWSWQHAPILTYWKAIGSATSDPLLFQPFLRAGGISGIAYYRWAALIAACLLLLAVTLCISQLLRQKAQPWQMLVGTVASCLAAVLLVQIASIDPRWNDGLTNSTEDQQMVSFLRENGDSQGMVVLDLDPIANINGRAWWWINASGLYPRAIGWRRRQQMTEEDRAVLLSWLKPYQRVWLAQASSSEGAPPTTTEQLLNEIGERSNEEWFGKERVVEYRLPQIADPAPIAARTDASFQFKDEVILSGYEVFSRPAIDTATDTYAIHLYWRQRPSDSWHLSVQALNADGTLKQQVDGPIANRPYETGYIDRISMVSSGECRLILKVYDYKTGEVLHLSEPEDVAGKESMTLCQP